MTNTNTNTATIILDGMSAGELFRLVDMLADAGADNSRASDEVHEYIEANARELYARAIEEGDDLAGAMIEEILEWADPDYYGELCARAEAEELVKAYRANPENRTIDFELQANAIDTNRTPNNLYRAGVFAGLAQAAAWAIYANSKADDINEIVAAVYKAYGVAY